MENNNGGAVFFHEVSPANVQQKIELENSRVASDVAELWRR